MKITAKLLHIPPYLSTSWAQVRALYIKDSNLVVSLNDGAVITVPGLDASTLNAIFTAHAAFLESQHQHPRMGQERNTPLFLLQSMPNAQTEGDATSSLKFGLDNLETLSSAMQHNPAQANMPDLPKEITDKIAAIARVVAPEDIQNMPKPEPHCNCMYCQIARAISQKDGMDAPAKSAEPQQVVEEEVKDEDLGFQQWEIKQTGDKLYSVVNRLDPQEKYSVYLGHPVGCTCGKAGCEHILAVLKS